MVGTINGLLILAIALIPGVPGETIFSDQTGLDWREDQLRRVIRTVIISIAGLLAYVFTDDLVNAAQSDLPDPRYIDPHYLSAGFSRSVLTAMAWSYTGHVLFSTLIGWGAAVVTVKRSEASDTTLYPAAWDDLIRTHVPGRWVLIGLTNGDRYRGIIETADTGVPSDDRDVLLADPVLFDKSVGGYVETGNQYLFLPAALISSVSVLRNPDVVKRYQGVPESPPLSDSETETS